MWATKL